MTTPNETPAERASPPPGSPSEATVPRSDDASWSRWDQPSGQWLLPGTGPETGERALVLEAAARLLFPTVLVFSVFLLFKGHYGPGGGFAGGMVAGLAFVLRHIAGGDDNLGSRFGIRPPVLVGTGLIIAVLTGLAPTLWGQAVLSSTKWHISFGAFGYLDIVTSLLLDLGIYLLIIGVVLDLLRSLGSGIARDAREAGETGETGEAGETTATERAGGSR